MKSGLLFGTCEFTRLFLKALYPRLPLEELHLITPPGKNFPAVNEAKLLDIVVHQIPNDGLVDWNEVVFILTYSTTNRFPHVGMGNLLIWEL